MVRVDLPADARCAVALSYDLEMCAGYSPVGVNHGRIMPPLQEYTLALCDTAERFDVQLHFFHVGNGLEVDDIAYLEEIVRRGHIIDNHTYNHVRLSAPDPAALSEELSLTNRRLGDRLGIASTVLRGPGGEPGGIDGLEANQQVVLDNGFRWVSCHFDVTMGKYSLDYDAAAAGRLQPYAYPTGLIEIPMHGFLDRIYFDYFRNVDDGAFLTWRLESGHEPVPDGWVCPWTAPGSLDDWIAYNLAAFDYAYDHRLLWVPVWHPYSHYLHDPDNRALPALLEHARAKLEPALIGTVRDAASMLSMSGGSQTQPNPYRRARLT